MTACSTSAASVAAIFLFSVALAVAVPTAAITGRFDEQRASAAGGPRNSAVLESGEPNSLEDVRRLVGLTHAGSSEDEEEPEMVEDDGGMTESVFESKRPWGKNNMALWGKRRSSYPLDDEESIDKRKWGQKNMALWGKRSEDNFRFPFGRHPLVTAAEKRKWGQKNMALWGR